VSTVRFTLIDEVRPHTVDATVAADGVRLAAKDVRAALGWELKPQGLCRDDVCLPVADPSRLQRSDGIDLAALAAALGRPLVIDVEARFAVLGTSARDRGQELVSGRAPEFTLPDLAGSPHALAEFRGRKVMLLAFASW
jgi:hypothetical protein